MTRPGAGGQRAQVAQRSLLATAEITAAASLAHVVAGGHPPGAGFLFAFASVVFCCCSATIGRLLHVGAVVPLVLAAQVGLHAALDTAPEAHHGAMHAMQAMPAVAPDGLLGVTPMMFWAHLSTALVTAILLLLQERVVAAVVGCWRSIDPAPLDLTVRRTARAAARRVRLARVVLLGVSPRRGPPVLLPATY
ncbi:MAG: hypothetical protein NTV23_15845 [Propionibacteriales bacterium]|nr:hypothetical protein [Propionibacteriales bacterium]